MCCSHLYFALYINRGWLGVTATPSTHREFPSFGICWVTPLPFESIHLFTLTRQLKRKRKWKCISWFRCTSEGKLMRNRKCTKWWSCRHFWSFLYVMIDGTLAGHLSCSLLKMIHRAPSIRDLTNEWKNVVWVYEYLLKMYIVLVSLYGLHTIFLTFIGWIFVENYFSIYSLTFYTMNSRNLDLLSRQRQWLL